MARAAAVVSLLLLPAACNAPGTEDEAYVVLDAAARRAGLTVEVAGEPHAGTLPVAVASDEIAVLSGPEQRRAIDLAPGQIAVVRGEDGAVELGMPERDALRVTAAEAPARALAERIGITPEQSGRGRWLFRGKDVLPIAALFDGGKEIKSIYEVEPLFTASPGKGEGTGERGTGPAERARADARALPAGEDEALLDFLAEHNGDPEDSPPELSPEEARRAREQIEKAVELKLILDGQKNVFDVSEPIPLRAELINHAWSSFWAVRPGDGSEMGWREPYVYLTAEREQAPGVWVDVPEERYSRCGNYDEEWDRDLVKLPPGGALNLERIVPPTYGLDLQREGRVRIYAHYQYRAGKGRRGLFGRRVRVPPELSSVPAYELVSPPVEIRIVRPLDVVLSARESIELDPTKAVDSVFDVSVINRSGAPITIPGEAKERWSGDRSEIVFEVEGERPYLPSEWMDPKVGFEGTQTLAPGGRLSLLSPGQAPAHVRLDRGHEPVVTRVRAEVVMYSQDGEWRRSVKSNWLDVNVSRTER